MAGCHNESLKSKTSFMYVEVFHVECVRVAMAVISCRKKVLILHFC